MWHRPRHHALPVDRHATRPQRRNRGQCRRDISCLASAAGNSDRVPTDFRRRLLNRLRQHRMRAEFDERGDAVEQHALHRSAELHRLAQVATPVRRVQCRAINTCAKHS